MRLGLRMSAYGCCSNTYCKRCPTTRRIYANFEIAVVCCVQGSAGERGVCGLLLAVRTVRPSAGAAVIPAGGPGADGHRERAI